MTVAVFRPRIFELPIFAREQREAHDRSVAPHEPRRNSRPYLRDLPEKVSGVCEDCCAASFGDDSGPTPRHPNGDGRCAIDAASCQQGSPSSCEFLGVAAVADGVLSIPNVARICCCSFQPIPGGKVDCSSGDCSAPRACTELAGARNRAMEHVRRNPLVS